MISKILKKYGGLMENIDQATREVYSRAPEIPCKNKCFDCCKQLFPVSFAEAFYISEGLKTLGRSLRRERTRVAEKIAEKIREKNPGQFERQAVSRTDALNTHGEFAKFLHQIESDCPALDPENPAGACTVYNFRNHDCRSMGFAFDGSSSTIVGCFRFASLKHLAPRLMPFNYKYAEKMELDRELIQEVTANAFTPNILYFTTMCGPLIRDYSAHDWIKFFSEKGVPARSNPEEYWVVIDV